MLAVCKEEADVGKRLKREDRRSKSAWKQTLLQMLKSTCSGFD